VLFYKEDVLANMEKKYHRAKNRKKLGRLIHKSDNLKNLSRREFLSRSGMLAGGAIRPSWPWACCAELRPILSRWKECRWQTGAYPGAGLAGMAAAYELGKLGYRCTILEARGRAEEDAGASGRARQYRDRTRTAYGKPGSGTIFQCRPFADPHHHALTLHYCRELNVPIQVYNNVNERLIISAKARPLSNKKIRAGAIHNDLRGCSASCWPRPWMVEDRCADDPGRRGNRSGILKAEGGLDIDKLYKASARRAISIHRARGKDGPDRRSYKLARSSARA